MHAGTTQGACEVLSQSYVCTAQGFDDGQSRPRQQDDLRPARRLGLAERLSMGPSPVPDGRQGDGYRGHTHLSKACGTKRTKPYAVSRTMVSTEQHGQDRPVCGTSRHRPGEEPRGAWSFTDGRCLLGTRSPPFCPRRHRNTLLLGPTRIAVCIHAGGAGDAIQGVVRTKGAGGCARPPLTWQPSPSPPLPQGGHPRPRATQRARPCSLLLALPLEVRLGRSLLGGLLLLEGQVVLIIIILRRRGLQR